MPTYATVNFDVTASVLYFDTTTYNYQTIDVYVLANNYQGCITFAPEVGLTYEAYVYNVTPWYEG